MQKIPDRYKGILYCFLGGVFLFLAIQMSGKSTSPSTVVDASSATNPKIPFFLIGMIIPALLFFLLKGRSMTTKDQEESKASPDEYTCFVDKAREARSLVRRNNRLVIAFVYALAFLACVQQMMKAKKLEDQIASYSIQGINIKK